MKKTAIIRTTCQSIVLTLLLVSVADAFDGIRRGFVFGGGLGLTPSASWEADSELIPDAGESGAGFGGAVLIGYAWNNNDMIVIEANGTAFKTDVGILDDVGAAQGFTGPAWYHYFGDVGGAVFTVVGLGAYLFQWEYTDTGLKGENDPGAGVLLGAGYEFTDHVQVGVYLGAGRTSEPGSQTRFNHGHVSILLGAVAF